MTVMENMGLWKLKHTRHDKWDNSVCWGRLYDAIEKSRTVSGFCGEMVSAVFKIKKRTVNLKYWKKFHIICCAVSVQSCYFSGDEKRWFWKHFIKLFTLDKIPLSLFTTTYYFNSAVWGISFKMEAGLQLWCFADSLMTELGHLVTSSFWYFSLVKYL